MLDQTVEHSKATALEPLFPYEMAKLDGELRSLLERAHSLFIG
jgi:hypothetical protein